MKNDANVSDPAEQLILVDREDRQIGTLAKLDCHLGDGMLHRAFSIFLVNSNGQVLMQKRSAGKPLWPLYWSNSCCSHPRHGEALEAAAHRRLREELDVECSALEFLYKFEYHAYFADVGAEHELCHVYMGRYDGEVRANEKEVAETRFFEPDELDRELARYPDRFTPWFKLEWAKLRSGAAANGGDANGSDILRNRRRN